MSSPPPRFVPCSYVKDPILNKKIGWLFQSELEQTQCGALNILANIMKRKKGDVKLHVHALNPKNVKNSKQKKSSGKKVWTDGTHQAANSGDEVDGKANDMNVDDSSGEANSNTNVVGINDVAMGVSSGDVESSGNLESSGNVESSANANPSVSPSESVGEHSADDAASGLLRKKSISLTQAEAEEGGDGSSGGAANSGARTSGSLNIDSNNPERFIDQFVDPTPDLHEHNILEHNYLIMVKGTHDFILLKLGREHGFPRGFPILWFPKKKQIFSFGFYPKFSNEDDLTAEGLSSKISGMVAGKVEDEDGGEAGEGEGEQHDGKKTSSKKKQKGKKNKNDETAPEAGDESAAMPTGKLELAQIEFFRKYSGFLSMFLAFPDPFDSNPDTASTKSQRLCYTVTSKNSADYRNSDFIKEAKRLWERHVSAGLIAEMVRDRICICAESMSWTDQVHGARVLSESVLVTAVGQGVTHADPLTRTTFVDFKNLHETNEFCRRFGLPSDAPTVLRGKENCAAFLHELAAKRDCMDEMTLRDLVTRSQGTNDGGGNSSDSNSSSSSSSNAIDSTNNPVSQDLLRANANNHLRILGNCLEGVVLHISFVKTVNQKAKNINEDAALPSSSALVQKTLTKKMTMKFKFPNYTCRTMVLREVLLQKTSLVSQSMVRGFQNFCKRWCGTDVGKRHWLAFLCLAAMVDEEVRRRAKELGGNASSSSSSSESAPSNAMDVDAAAPEGVVLAGAETGSKAVELVIQRLANDLMKPFLEVEAALTDGDQNRNSVTSINDAAASSNNKMEVEGNTKSEEAGSQNRKARQMQTQQRHKQTGIVAWHIQLADAVGNVFGIPEVLSNAATDVQAKDNAMEVEAPNENDETLKRADSSLGSLCGNLADMRTQTVGSGDRVRPRSASGEDVGDDAKEKRRKTDDDGSKDKENSPSRRGSRTDSKTSVNVALASVISNAFVKERVLRGKHLTPDTTQTSLTGAQSPGNTNIMSDNKLSSPTLSPTAVFAAYKRRLEGRFTATVFIVVGPVGFGKTSTANLIEQKMTEILSQQHRQKESSSGNNSEPPSTFNFPRLEHIDGDVLGLTEALVLRAGPERQDLTLFRIIESIFARGNIPIVSCGGGVLFENVRDDRGKKAEKNMVAGKTGFIVRSMLRAALGVEAKIVLVRPKEEGDGGDDDEDVNNNTSGIGGGKKKKNNKGNKGDAGGTNRKKTKREKLEEKYGGGQLEVEESKDESITANSAKEDSAVGDSANATGDANNTTPEVDMEDKTAAGASSTKNPTDATTVTPAPPVAKNILETAVFPFDSREEISLSDTYDSLYKDREPVVATVLWRLRMNKWTLPASYKNQKHFAEFIASLSGRNQSFCQKLSVEADVILEYTRSGANVVAELIPQVLAESIFPRGSQSDGNTSNTSNANAINSTSPRSPFSHAVFLQSRFLVDYSQAVFASDDNTGNHDEEGHDANGDLAAEKMQDESGDDKSGEKMEESKTQESKAEESKTEEKGEQEKVKLKATANKPPKIQVPCIELRELANRLGHVTLKFGAHVHYQMGRMLKHGDGNRGASTTTPNAPNKSEVSEPRLAVSLSASFLRFPKIGNVSLLVVYYTPDDNDFKSKQYLGHVTINPGPHAAREMEYISDGFANWSREQMEAQVKVSERRDAQTQVPGATASTAAASSSSKPGGSTTTPNASDSPEAPNAADMDTDGANGCVNGINAAAPPNTATKKSSSSKKAKKSKLPSNKTSNNTLLAILEDGTEYRVSDAIIEDVENIQVLEIFACPLKYPGPDHVSHEAFGKRIRDADQSVPSLIDIPCWNAAREIIGKLGKS